MFSLIYCIFLLSLSPLVSCVLWWRLLEPGLHLSEYLMSSCLHLVLTCSPESDEITSS